MKKQSNPGPTFEKPPAPPAPPSRKLLASRQSIKDDLCDIFNTQVAHNIPVGLEYRFQVRGIFGWVDVVCVENGVKGAVDKW